MEITFPSVVDSSMRSAFVACPRQGFYAHHLHLRREEPSIHLHFGKCVAAGLETTRKAYWGAGLSATEAVAAGCRRILEEWGDFTIPENIAHTLAGYKTLDAALDALTSYFERFPLGSDSIKPLMLDGEPAVEKSFALPIPDCFHPETGEPLLYSGRFDMLALYHNAAFVVDEKTSLRLGSSWASSWTMRGQMTGYVWGSRLWNVSTQGCIIRGIGILKGSISFEEAIVSRPAWHVDAWLRQLVRDVRRMIDHWEAYKQLYREQPHLAWDQAFDQACSSYGGCGYVPLCDTEDPERWYGDYIVAPWNPLTRDEGR